uniref:Uncharacterized protein n=1 Tax=Plectus sambesii TaxID=2011161 RepID=A0A914XD18_9BILA
MIKGKMTTGTRTITELPQGKYRMNVTNTPKGDIEYTFVLGETFEGMGPDGKPHKITFSVSGDRLIEHHEHIEGNRKGDIDITEYFLENGYVVATMAAKEIVWKRYYKKD